MRKNWRAIPGEGTGYLKDITEDVVRWNKLGDNLEPLLLLSRELRAANSAYPSMDDIVTDENIGDLDALMAELNEAHREVILRRHMAGIAIDRLIDVKRGRELGGYGDRASVTVVDIGVIRSKLFGTSQDIEGSRCQPDQGAVIEGTIKQLVTSPLKGGAIVLRQFFHDIKLEGLVDPTDGQPRVELDILAKS